MRFSSQDKDKDLLYKLDSHIATYQPVPVQW